MNAHIFTPATDDRFHCTACGKTRNTNAHKVAKVEMDARNETLDAIDDAADKAAGVELPETDMAAQVAEARKDLLPEVDAQVDDSEIADALAALDAEQGAAKAATKKSPAKKAAPAKTVRLWVGWRITNAAVLEKGTLAKKLREAKPTSELDRYVHLTVEEMRTLDAIAAKFAEPGNTGPVVYSARTLRRRLAEAIATLEAGK